MSLCGHATLGSGHALMEGDSDRFLTRKAGILEVRRIGPGYELDLPAWESVPKALPDIVAGMRQEPAKTLWREGGYGLLVYESAAQVRAPDPDFRILRALGNILIIATAPGAKPDIVRRPFAHGPGLDAYQNGKASGRERGRKK